jgi:hypothetical protein
MVLDRLERRLETRAFSRLWNRYPPRQEDQPFKFFQGGYPFAEVEPRPDEVSDPDIIESIRNYNRAYQYEYILQWETSTIIEPDQGWAIDNFNRLVEESLAYSRDNPVAPPRLTRYLADYLVGRTRHIQEEEIAISLRDPGELNYWHFYNDVLPKLLLLKSQGFPDDIPAVIAKELYARPYFQAAIDGLGWANRPWIVQGQQYIRAKRAIFCKPMPHSQEYLKAIVEALRPPTPAKARKVFLARNSSRGRTMRNMDAVQRIARDCGFEIVDADQLSLAEQMRVFSETEVLLATHGAGMVNMIFRQGAPMTVIEIFPSILIPPHYFWLSRQMGYAYRGLLGEKYKRSDRSFELDTGLLKKTLTQALS